jgi:hypothetical protein
LRVISSWICGRCEYAHPPPASLEMRPRDRFEYRLPKSGVRGRLDGLTAVTRQLERRKRAGPFENLR